MVEEDSERPSMADIQFASYIGVDQWILNNCTLVAVTPNVKVWNASKKRFYFRLSMLEQLVATFRSKVKLTKPAVAVADGAVAVDSSCCYTSYRSRMDAVDDAGCDGYVAIDQHDAVFVLEVIERWVVCVDGAADVAAAAVAD